MNFGLETKSFLIDIRVKSQSGMYDQSIRDDRESIDPFTVLDLALNYRFDSYDVYVKVDNLLGGDLLGLIKTLRCKTR